MELAVGKQKVAWVSVSFSLSVGCPSTVRGAAFSQASQGRSCWVLGSVIHQWAWPMLLGSSHTPSATAASGFSFVRKPRLPNSGS